MESTQDIEKIEEMIKELLSQQLHLSQRGISPHLIAGAILAFGIDRFGAVVGQNHAASVLEQAAVDLRARAGLLH
jgi:hypothetical protein